jgi:uncharacterized protein YqgC (DUF456 family)
MLDLIVEIIFLTAILGSFFSNFFGLPGNLLIALDSLIYGLVTNFNSFTFTFVLTLFLIVLISESLEYFLIIVAARRYGASKWGISGSIIGGIAGAISGAFVTPVIGAIIGSVVGVFLGGTLLEFFKSYNLRAALNSGIGSFIGKIGGLSVKTCAAVTMLIMIGYRIY